MAPVLLAHADAGMRAQLRRDLDGVPEIQLLIQVEQGEAAWRLLQELR